MRDHGFGAIVELETDIFDFLGGPPPFVIALNYNVADYDCVFRLFQHKPGNVFLP